MPQGETTIAVPRGLSRLGGYIHGTLGWPVYVFWTVVVGGFIGLGALLGRVSVARWALHFVWGRLMWWTIPFWRRHMGGLQNIGQGPYVVVSNHVSVIDIPCLYGLPLPLAIATRPGIFHVKVMGPFVRMSGQVNTEHFFEEASALLKQGVSILVFPEGTRSPDGLVHRFRGGAFELASRTGTPILPVATYGAQGILAKRLFFPLTFIVHVMVRVLPVVNVEQGQSARELSRSVRSDIAEVVAGFREKGWT